MSNIENFIKDCQAFNNTMVRRLPSGVFVDSLKNLTGHSDKNYKLVAVYMATNSEQCAAAGDESCEASTFKIDGKGFICHAFQVVMK